MKNIKFLVLTILTLFMLAACASNEENDQTENNETGTEEINITLTITDNTTNNTIDESEYTVEDGTVLIDVLEENYEVEVTDEGFLTGIEGASQNETENIYWLYEVNDEMPNEGVSDYVVEDQDDITFDLQELE